MIILSLGLVCLTVWAAAVVALQNPEGVSLGFLALRSVELPLGILSALALGLGILVVPLLAVLWSRGPRFSETAQQLQQRMGELE